MQEPALYITSIQIKYWVNSSQQTMKHKLTSKNNGKFMPIGDLLMSSVTNDQILTALEQVIDPETQKNIVELKMVSGLSIRDETVIFALEVDPAKGPELEPLRQQAENAVKALPGVSQVTAMLTAHKKPQAPTIGRPKGVKPEAPAPTRAPIAPDVKHIIAVASGKGGVGKSTCSVNLALGLAQLGLKVGILDADIYGPSLPRMLKITGKPKSNGGKSLEPMENYGLKVMSMGFLVEEETPMIWRGPMVQSAIQQMLRDVNWGTLDVLVVDMPPGTGDAQLTLAQQVPLAGAVIVSTPQDIALLDARKGLSMFQRVEVPTLGIIENMSVFTCPKCGHEEHIFGHNGAKEEAEKLNVPFLGHIPLARDICFSADAGEPLQITQPEGENAKIWYSIAQQVKDNIEANATKRAAPNISIS